MDCGTYIDNFLAAHVDGELEGEDKRRADQHVAGCANCRAELEEQRALKALLRERAGMLRTPAPVRVSLRAALDSADAGARVEARPPAAAQRPSRRLRSARIWAPIAVAAAAVLAIILVHNRQPAFASIPEFDMAVASFATFERHFEPNVGSATPADVSDAYLIHNMPGYIWNFWPSGYRLVGGRIDRLPDGRPVAYTFYRGERGDILCTYVKAPLIEPVGARAVGSHAYYQYKGYSICLSYYPNSGYLCILVSPRPLNQFVQDIADSSP
ncbi:MAG TPA: zf-HC2 domain-containing protein [Candidatus Binataceae bacterium]